MESAPPKDFSYHYSRVAQRTQRSLIKKFYKYFVIPGIGNFAGGLPDPKYFPFDDLEAKVAAPDRFKPSPNKRVDPGSSTSSDLKNKDIENRSSAHVVVPHDSNQPDPTRKLDLTVSLQYGRATGLPVLNEWLREFTQKLHPNVPYQGGPEIVPTHGSTDGFNKVLNLLTDNWDDRKDWVRDRQGVLYEKFVYMTAVQNARPRGLNIVPVEVDQQGLATDGPGGLRDVLENWDRSKGRRPHVLYTVPVGQNPTSGTVSINRKRDIYALCQKYDVMIVEDDPYWFLQYPTANDLSLKYRGKPISPDYAQPSPVSNSKSSDSPYLDSLVPSYLSIDTDGRVIRLDTFSKMIAPGCRLGWITAQPAIIDKTLDFSDLMMMQPSGFVQSMVAELVVGQQPSPTDKKSTPEHRWQLDGFLRWLEGLRGNYERRMQSTSHILELGKYTITNTSNHSSRDSFEILHKTQLYTFNFPMGGMFIWIRMSFENHALFNHPRTPTDKLGLAFWVFLTTPKYMVLVAPGTMFCADEKTLLDEGSFYYRLCFAAVPEEQLETVTRNFTLAAHDFWDLQDPKDIDDILKDDAEGSSVEELAVELQGVGAARGGFMY